VYSQAGGLGVRVKGLSRGLARMGYTTYLYFCGDPDLPGEEEVEDGRLHLRRWCQWISAQHRGGVYDGEEGKIRDWNYSLPASLRSAAAAEHMWFKIGRFDPDKRWLMAVSAAALLKRRGRSVKLLMRGGREPHGAEVIGHAINQGLVVRNSASPPNAAELVTLLTATNGTDIINLTTFLDDSLVPLMYSACDAVLANSGHEPFGLVGLEVMAAGGIAVTGATGEVYAEAYRNSVVVETDDTA